MMSDRKSVVEHHLARIGLSLDDPGSKLQGPAPVPKPEPYGPALPDWWHWRHEFAWGGTYPVSQTLAKQLGYTVRRPGFTAGDDPEARND